MTRPDAAVPDSPPLDAGPRCTFSLVQGGTPIDCAIELTSTESCAETAICLCDAQPGIDTTTARLACASPELVARGALTFADFCTDGPPARLTLTEVIEEYLGRAGTATGLDISPTCDQLPALIGPRPYVDCGAIASVLCQCATDCDLDRSLGRACLDMPAEHVACIAGHMWESSDLCAFVPQLPSLAIRCE